MLHGSEKRELKHIPKIVSIICQRLLQLAAIEPTSNQKVEAYDIRKSHPKAFHEMRKDVSVDINKETTRSLNDADDMRRPTKLPPLRIQRKSSSLEQLMRSRDKNREESDSIKSSNNDSDEEPTSSHPSRLSSPSTSSLVLRQSKYSRSQYILSDALNLDDDSCVNEVYIVAKSLAFDIDADLNDIQDAEKRTVVEGLKQRVESLQMNLNAHNNTWNILATEEDPFVLSSLLWSWLLHLKEPVLSRNDVDYLCNNSEELTEAFKTLPKGIECTVACVLNVVACLRPLCKKLEKPILSQVVYGLTHVQDSTNELYYVRFIEKVIMALVGRQ